MGGHTWWSTRPHRLPREGRGSGGRRGNGGVHSHQTATCRAEPKLNRWDRWAPMTHTVQYSVLCEVYVEYSGLLVRGR